MKLKPGRYRTVELIGKAVVSPANTLTSQVERLIARGVALAQQGDWDEVCDCFRSVLKIEPFNADAYNNLGVAYRRMGKLPEAIEQLCFAVGIAPDNVQYQINLANCLLSSGNRPDALRAAAKIKLPENADWFSTFELAELLFRCGDASAARATLSSARPLHAKRQEMSELEVGIHFHLGEYQDALVAIDRDLDSCENPIRLLLLRARSLVELQRTQEAFESYIASEALANGAQLLDIRAERAWLLAETGQLEEAEAILRAAALSPEATPQVLSRLYYLRRRVSDDDLARMEILSASPQITREDRIDLGFTLGRLYLERGDGENAFRRLNEANGLVRATADYSPQADTARLQRIQRQFAPDRRVDLIPKNPAQIAPIFIVGMPRSGSTMLEQILLAHPAIGMGGEWTSLFDAIQSTLIELKGDLTSLDVEQVGWRYELLAPSGIRFIDKMPWNFWYVGLAGLAMPNAKIVHCRRNALDTCLSCYSTLFSSGHTYSYNLGELGAYYRLYQETMECWRSQISRHQMIEIDYEVLVANPDEAARRVMEFCGLEWDPTCLEFHKRQSLVRTASLSQVRQPIYASSVGRAEKFRPWLEDLGL